MPKRYLTKFDEDGERCKNDVSYLRKHPECGLPFIQDKPFNPDKPVKFSQIKRDFPMNRIDKLVPRVPTHVAPLIPGTKPDIDGDIKNSSPYGVYYLKQDYTNNIFRRRIVDPNDGYNLVSTEEHGMVPRLGNSAYAHQDLIPSFEAEPSSLREPYSVGDIQLQDFGAGTGINMGTNFAEATPERPPPAEPPADLMNFTPADLIYFTPKVGNTRKTRVKAGNFLSITDIRDLPEDILQNIERMAQPTNILDLPEHIRQKILDFSYYMRTDEYARLHQTRQESIEQVRELREELAQLEALPANESNNLIIETHRLVIDHLEGLLRDIDYVLSIKDTLKIGDNNPSSSKRTEDTPKIPRRKNTPDYRNVQDIQDLPDDVLKKIEQFGRRQMNILDLPENIRKKIIWSEYTEEASKQLNQKQLLENVKLLLNQIAFLEEQSTDELNDPDLRETYRLRAIKYKKMIKHLQKLLGDSNALKIGDERYIEERQRGIEDKPKIPRPRGSNSNQLQETALQNLTRNTTPREEENIRKQRIREGKQRMRKIEIEEGDIPEGEVSVPNPDVHVNELPMNLAREIINRGYVDPEGLINLEAIQSELAGHRRDLEVLTKFVQGEQVETKLEQIKELQRLYDDILTSRNNRPDASPPDAPPSPPEEQMFPIEPIDEYTVAIQEVAKIMRPTDTALTEAQKEIIIKEMEKRGVSRQRSLEILEEAELYDPAMERALGGRTKTKVERLARAIRGALQHQHNDSNFAPMEIDITPETPMLSREQGRGRSRLQKEIQKRAGQLPEQYRQGYKRLTAGASQVLEGIDATRSQVAANIRSRSTQILGQRYNRVSDIDSATNAFDIDGDGFVNITPETLALDPLGEDVMLRAGRPKITYAENLRRVRNQAFSREGGVAGIGSLAGLGVGMGVGYGMDKLLNKLGIQQNIGTSTLTGGIAGATGDVGGRIASMSAASALEKAGIRVGAETLASAGLSSLVRGAAEGGGIGIVLTPVDILLNQGLYHVTKSHTVANVTSGTTVGAVATGIAMAAAPETAGLSLVVGGLAVGVTSVLGYFSGKHQDEEEAKVNKIREKINGTSQERTKLLATLKDYGYDYERALYHYGEKEGQNRNALGINDDTWDTFDRSSNFRFQPNPVNYSPQNDDDISDDERKVNNLFSKYVTHYTIQRICYDHECSEELKARDKGGLTLDERNFMNNQTGKTWEDQAQLQVETQMNLLQYTQVRIADAHRNMLDTWKTKGETIKDPKVLALAYTDPTWKQKFDKFAKIDAQNRVIRAYQDNQRKFDQMPQDIQTMANLDPEFDTMIHHYYDTMETTAEQMNISIPQLVRLQGTPIDQQDRVYEGFQFDNIKTNQEAVSEAQTIAKEEDAVRNGAIKYYDIDQAYLESDPTNLTTWNPSDAQILQAYQAGLTLREYTDYMHELAKGEDGDFSRLPVYTQEQIKQFTQEDVAHFEDELSMSGHKGLYTWDEKNRNWVIHNQNDTTQYTSQYTPGRLLKARKEYANMIHGLNDQNQQEVDNYNANLMRELSSYGRHYDSIVADINNERLYQGRNDLLFYDIGKIYNNNKMEFKPLSTIASNNNVSNNNVSNNNVSIKQKYGLSDRQYADVKNDIVSKNIKDPNMEQVETAVQEVKSSSSSSPPMAS